MKKMFGEHGWLGTSADENWSATQPSKKGFVTHMEFSNRPKKLGMMEKLKNKFEDMVIKTVRFSTNALTLLGRESRHESQGTLRTLSFQYYW
jgi:hypothetical protein